MVLPLFRITDLLIGDMRARKWGRILNVASMSVVEPIAAIGVSNTLRSAIVGWAKTLATETARDGITVNTLLPGAIATDRTVQLSRAAAERQKISVEEAIQRSAQIDSRSDGSARPRNSARSRRSWRARWRLT